MDELGEGEQLEADADEDEDDDEEEFDISSRFNASVVFKTSLLLLLFSYVLIGGSFRVFREGFFGGDDG